MSVDVIVVIFYGFSFRWAQPRQGSEGLNDFIEDLGRGQVVGRQVLGTSCMGMIQMGLSDKKGRLEVELIRAKALQQKPGSKQAPSKFILCMTIKENQN